MPAHGAQVDGIPAMVKLGRRELRVLRVVTTYSVHKLGEGFRGMGWKLQLEDYRRVVVFHEAYERWFLASQAEPGRYGSSRQVVNLVTPLTARKWRSSH